MLDANAHSNHARAALTEFLDQASVLLTYTRPGTRTPRAASGTLIRSGTAVAVLSAGHALKDEPLVSVIARANACFEAAVERVEFAPDRAVDVGLAFLRYDAAETLRPWALELDQVENSAVESIKRNAQLAVVGFPHQYAFDRGVPNGVEHSFVPLVRYITDHNHDHRTVSLDWDKAFPTARALPPELGFKIDGPTALKKPNWLSGGGVFIHTPSPTSRIWSPDLNVKLIGVAIEYKNRRELAVPWWRWHECGRSLGRPDHTLTNPCVDVGGPRGDGVGMSDPFEPPKPPPTSPAETAGAIAGLVGLAAVDIATGGLLSTLAAIPGGSEPEPEPFVFDPTLAGTALPPRDTDGNVACSRCGTFVSWASMSLDEHGYFCAACVNSDL